MRIGVVALIGASCASVILEGGLPVVGINAAGYLEAGGWIFARDGLGPNGPIRPWPTGKGDSGYASGVEEAP